VDRLLRRSVVDLAQQVDDALGALAQARGQEEAARLALNLAQDDVRDAQARVAEARAALFKEHPDLVGDSQPTNNQEPTVHPRPDSLLPGQDPSKFEVVEVDDSDDPRFTAGFSTTPTDDGADLPPIDFVEHEE